LFNEIRDACWAFGPGQLNSRVRDPEGVFATRGGLQPWARCAEWVTALPAPVGDRASTGACER